MTPEDKIERGRQAAAVLDSPAYKAAFEKFTQEIRSLRLALGPRDSEGAYRLVLMEQAVEKARRHMESFMFDADAARKELEKAELPGPIGRMTGRVRHLVR